MSRVPHQKCTCPDENDSQRSLPAGRVARSGLHKPPHATSWQPVAPPSPRSSPWSNAEALDQLLEKQRNKPWSHILPRRRTQNNPMPYERRRRLLMVLLLDKDARQGWRTFSSAHLAIVGTDRIKHPVREHSPLVPLNYWQVFVYVRSNTRPLQPLFYAFGSKPAGGGGSGTPCIQGCSRAAWRPIRWAGSFRNIPFSRDASSGVTACPTSTSCPLIFSKSFSREVSWKGRQANVQQYRVQAAAHTSAERPEYGEPSPVTISGE